MESRLSSIAASIWPSFAIIVLLALYHRRATAWRVYPKYIPWVPTDLPWHGTIRKPLTRIQAHFLDLKRGKDFTQEGYDKYSKVGEPFLAPSFATWQPEVTLPPSHIKWLVQQPDSVLSLQKCLMKALECEYTTPKAWSFTRPFHLEAINKMRLELLAESIADGIQTGIDEQWGLDTEQWTEVNIHETMLNVLTRVTSHVVVGQPVCNNAEFLNATTTFVSNLTLSAFLISLTPELLRPLSAWFLTRGLKRSTKICAKHMTPLIEEVMHRRPSDQMTMAPPKTLLEQLSRLAARSTHQADRCLSALSIRLLSLSFVAVHTSGQAIQNALVDILSPPASTEGVFDQLRAESDEVWRQHSCEWSKAAVAQLVKTDSALRESLRFSTFKARSLERIVVKKGGVVLPSGQFLPQGTKVGVPVLPIHHDNDVYQDAGVFDAFRFSRPKHDGKGASGRFETLSAGGHVDLVNTSESFLAFGHGAHSCPGRYLAAHELKVIVAYIAMHYDIQPFESRPSNLTFTDFSDSGTHTLRIRRRKGREQEGS